METYLKALYAEQASFLLKSLSMGLGLGMLMGGTALVPLQQPTYPQRMPPSAYTWIASAIDTIGLTCAWRCFRLPSLTNEMKRRFHGFPHPCPESPALLPNWLPGRQPTSLLVHLFCPGCGWGDLLSQLPQSLDSFSSTHMSMAYKAAVVHLITGDKSYFLFPLFLGLEVKYFCAYILRISV